MLLLAPRKVRLHRADGRFLDLWPAVSYWLLPTMSGTKMRCIGHKLAFFAPCRNYRDQAGQDGHSKEWQPHIW